VIGLEPTSAQARFAKRRELTWIADGATIAMPGLERALSQSQSGVIEQLTGTLYGLAGRGRRSRLVGSVGASVLSGNAIYRILRGVSCNGRLWGTIPREPAARRAGGREGCKQADSGWD
jgi:hypothetical protein